MLVVALVIAHGLYRSRRGEWLNVSPIRLAATCDSVTLLVGVILCAGVPAAMITWAFEVQNPLHEMGDEGAALVAGVIGLGFGVPLMSLFATLFSPSWIRVSPIGITQQRMILRSHTPWDEINSITVENRRVRGRDHWGNPTERGSIDLGVLEFESERSVITLLPPPRRVRTQLVRRLREHVPVRLRETLERHLEVWM